MSEIIKTFKSAVHAGRSIEIEERHPVGSFVRVVHEDKAAGTTVAHADAPAFCLAILEAAGHRPAAYDPERLSGDDLLKYIAHKLAVHVRDEDKRAKEAADREKLEGEAWELYSTPAPGGDRLAFDSMRAMSGGVRTFWIDVARKAREIHGPTK